MVKRCGDVLINNPQLPLSLKWHVSKMAIRRIFSNRDECRTTKKQKELKVHVAEE